MISWVFFTPYFFTLARKPYRRGWLGAWYPDMIRVCYDVLFFLNFHFFREIFYDRLFCDQIFCDRIVQLWGNFSNAVFVSVFAINSFDFCWIFRTVFLGFNGGFVYYFFFILLQMLLLLRFFSGAWRTQAKKILELMHYHLCFFMLIHWNVTLFDGLFSIIFKRVQVAVKNSRL